MSGKDSSIATAGLDCLRLEGEVGVSCKKQRTLQNGGALHKWVVVAVVKLCKFFTVELHTS